MSSVLRAVTPRPQAVLLTEDDRARERGYRGPMARELGRRFLPGARTWDRHQVIDVLVAVVFGALCVLLGVIPSPLFHLAAHAGNAISGII